MAESAVVAACREVLAEPRAGRVLVGYSGGMDSTVLLHAIVGLLPAGIPAGVPAGVVAIHVDHALTADSARWRAHCERFCRDLGVALQTERVDVGAGPNLEARARRARYGVFASLIGPGDVLLLAHHGGDQAETLLLHVLQGRGAFGIPRRRPLAQGDVLRPLLSLPVSALAEYARIEGLEWVKDPSNQDGAIDRNFLRNDILPLLEGRFRHLLKRIEHVQGQTQDAQSMLVDAFDLGRHPLPVAVLEGQALSQQVLLLRLWLVGLRHSTGVRDSALAQYAAQLSSPGDRQPELRLSSATVRRYRRNLYLVGPDPILDVEYAMPASGRLTLPHGELQVIGPGTPGSSEAGSLRICFRRHLPALHSLCVRGHPHRINELLRTANVPPWQRDDYPLLFDAQGLLAVPGVAVRDPAVAPVAAPVVERAGPVEPHFEFRWWPFAEGVASLSR